MTTYNKLTPVTAYVDSTKEKINIDGVAVSSSVHNKHALHMATFTCTRYLCTDAVRGLCQPKSPRSADFTLIYLHYHQHD